LESKNFLITYKNSILDRAQRAKKLYERSESICSYCFDFAFINI